MSKASRSKKKAKRLVEKQKRKAAQASLYKKYAEMGREKKSGRFKRKNSGAKIRTKRHVTEFCGNIGCSRCFPELHKKMNEKKNLKREG